MSIIVFTYLVNTIYSHDRNHDPGPSTVVSTRCVITRLDSLVYFQQAGWEEWEGRQNRPDESKT